MGSILPTSGLPTALSLSFAVNSIIVTSQAGDREFYSVVVPTGATLTALGLAALGRHRRGPPCGRPRC